MGLEGLGNINNNNASATITNEQSILDKVQEDSRMITLNTGKFTRCEDLANYLSNWLEKQLGLHNTLNSSRVILAIGQQTWEIYCVRNLDDVHQVLQSGQINSMVVPVIFGYYTAPTNSEIYKQLKMRGFERFSLDDIYTLNNAIDAGSKKLPYLSIGAAKLCDILTKMANDNAKQTGVFNTNTVLGDVGHVGQSLSSSFSEGFSQLKESVGTLVAGLKSTQAHHVAPQQMQQMQQPQQMQQMINENMTENMTKNQGVSLVKPSNNTEESVNLVDENLTVENKSNPVSLKK